MRTYIRHIGIVDHANSVHAVSFTPGVNVITGKSSTGKSAMIEIFDYCFGSSDFTVPEGVITKNSDIYFVVIQVKDSTLVLARKRDSRDAFIKEEADEAMVVDKDMFRSSYFTAGYFIPIADFKKELGRYFGLVITDVDENVEERMFRGNRKSPTPSIRSFASFMLQHQNLVANKHAIFYRFDEKEKREQTIEHFKIFTGFADQTYFLKSQELSRLKVDLRQIEQQIPKASEVKRRAREELQEAIREYAAISGGVLEIGAIEEAVQNPMRTLELIRATRVSIMPLSDEHVRQREALENQKAKLTGEYRNKQKKLSAIRASIKFAKHYTTDVQAISIPTNAEVHVSECPFCNSSLHEIEQEANDLQDAIGWLNEELRRSPYLFESFEEDEKQIVDGLEQDRQTIQALDDKIMILDEQILDLINYKSQTELTLKAKWQVEALLENLLDKKDNQLTEQRAELKQRIESLNRFLREQYNLKAKLEEAEEYIRSVMEEIGSRFEFEDSYRPIKLRFSVETFDLWHEAQERKVFLRSMGSGANWLYCHLTLFLALHRYFCMLGDLCSIPSIIFFDQPSQVYFPSVVDHAVKFDPNKLAKLEGESRTRPVDEDVRAVANLYSQLIRFCKKTLEETGIEPQIIVTDHADNLELEGDTSFESLVAGRRWRTHGFIQFNETE
jgi:hypothetical protein